MDRRIKRSFFARPAKAIAPELLGKFLVRKMPDGSHQEGMITEVEAYVGKEDLASHAAGGRRTKRNEVMFGPPGHAYIYFTYGMHWLLNVVCSSVDDPQAVLIRGLDVVSGPARLTKLLDINKELNGEDLVESKILWLENRSSSGRPDVRPSDIKVTPRIGVDYAGEWKNKPLRFLIGR
jgi:DNA-3-methyladenine glycosylase